MKLAELLILLLKISASAARAAHRGLNLPATQGTTRDGAFFPGLLKYDYKPDQVGRAARRAGFNSLRLAVNVETANNNQSLQKHKAYIDAVGGRGIICMFDTSIAPGTSWPRTGTISGKVEKVAQAWKNVHNVFAPYGEDVMYEIFNEPWGYKANAAPYVADMGNVVRLAGLPENRVILAGLYGSADVRSVAQAGWPGYMAYHVYVFWLPEGQRSKEHFSKKIHDDLTGLSDRIFITEFGVGLDGLKADVDEDDLQHDVIRYVDKASLTTDWHIEQPEGLDIKTVCAKYPLNVWCTKHLSLVQEPNKALVTGASAGVAANLGADVVAQVGAAAKKAGEDMAEQAKSVANIGADVAAQISGVDPGAAAAQTPMYQNDTMAFLRGMRDALWTFKRQGAGVRGLHHWHGWHNGDTWDFWDAANARSSRMIQMMMQDQGEGSAPKDSYNDEFMSEDFVQDEQQVHMMLARSLESKSTSKSAAECPAVCSAKTCQAGNPAQIGGKHLTGNLCNHMCSKPYNGMRWCGAGVGYTEGDAIDCGGCAHPRMCSGLPCWASSPTQDRAKHVSFLHKRKWK